MESAPNTAPPSSDQGPSAANSQQSPRSLVAQESTGQMRFPGTDRRRSSRLRSLFNMRFSEKFGSSASNPLADLEAQPSPRRSVRQRLMSLFDSIPEEAALSGIGHHMPPIPEANRGSISGEGQSSQNASAAPKANGQPRQKSIFANNRRIAPASDDFWGNLEERTLIYPDAEFLRWWEMLKSTLLVYTALFIPFFFAFEVVPTGGYRIFVSSVDFFFMVDIFINFRTAVMRESEAITDWRRIAKNYIMTWFFFDAIAAFPYFIMVSDPNIGLALTLPRVARLIVYVRMVKANIWATTSNMARVVRLGFNFYLVAHWAGCAWFYVTRVQGYPGNTFSAGPSIADLSITSKYIRAIAWGLTNLAGLGGSLLPMTDEECLLSSVVVLVALFVFAGILGSMNSAIANLDRTRSQFRDRLQAVDEFMKYRRLPQDIRFRIRQYYERLWHLNRGLDERTILDDLPRDMKMEISMHLHKNLLQKVPLFRDAEEAFIRALSLKIQPELCPPGNYVFRQGERGAEMYFISRGRVQIVAADNKTIIAELGEGAHFGEIAILSDATRSASVQAIEVCELFVLHKSDFVQLLEQYPKVGLKIHQVAQEREKTKGLSINPANRLANAVEKIRILKEKAGVSEKDRHPTEPSEQKESDNPTGESTSEPVGEENEGNLNSGPNTARTFTEKNEENTVAEQSGAVDTDLVEHIDAVPESHESSNEKKDETSSDGGDDSQVEELHERDRNATSSKHRRSRKEHRQRKPASRKKSKRKDESDSASESDPRSESASRSESSYVSSSESKTESSDHVETSDTDDTGAEGHAGTLPQETSSNIRLNDRNIADSTSAHIAAEPGESAHRPNPDPEPDADQASRANRYVSSGAIEEPSFNTTFDAPASSSAPKVKHESEAHTHGMKEKSAIPQRISQETRATPRRHGSIRDIFARGLGLSLGLGSDKSPGDSGSEAHANQGTDRQDISGSSSPNAVGSARSAKAADQPPTHSQVKKVQGIQLFGRQFSFRSQDQDDSHSSSVFSSRQPSVRSKGHDTRRDLSEHVVVDIPDAPMDSGHRKHHRSRRHYRSESPQPLSDRSHNSVRVLSNAQSQRSTNRASRPRPPPSESHTGLEHKPSTRSHTGRKNKAKDKSKHEVHHRRTTPSLSSSPSSQSPSSSPSPTPPPPPPPQLHSSNSVNRTKNHEGNLHGRDEKDAEKIKSEPRLEKPVKERGEVSLVDLPNTVSHTSASGDDGSDDDSGNDGGNADAGADSESNMLVRPSVDINRARRE